MIQSFKRLLDRHRHMQGNGSCTGRRDQFILVSCSSQTLRAKGPVPVLYFFMYDVKLPKGFDRLNTGSLFSLLEEPRMS